MFLLLSLAANTSMHACIHVCMHATKLPTGPGCTERPLTPTNAHFKAAEHFGTKGKHICVQTAFNEHLGRRSHSGRSGTSVQQIVFLEEWAFKPLYCSKNPGKTCSSCK